MWRMCVSWGKGGQQCDEKKPDARREGITVRPKLLYTAAKRMKLREAGTGGLEVAVLMVFRDGL